MKSKFILFLLMLLLIGKIYGQKDINDLNGYKIVFLPYQFSSIVSSVENKFKDIGFKVFRDEVLLKSDDDFKNDPNLALICQINHTYSYPHTTIGIKLINANNEVLFEKTENSRGKSFVSFNIENDQKWVIDKIFSEFDNFNYRFNTELSLSNQLLKDLPDVEITDETEESLKEYYSNNRLNPIEGIYKSYKADNLPYYKIGIRERDNKYVAIIIEAEQKNIWKAGEVKAYFEPSSMKGFYSVKWYMGNKTSYETFAMMENEAILSIEFKNPQTGEKRTDKFIKMYPPADGEITFKEVQKSSGSGFFLTTNGIIATNAHVVDNAETLKVQISNEIGNFEYSAKVLLVDSKNDVALIKIEDEKFQGLSSIPYSLVEKADIGEKAFTIGYPLNDVMGTNYKVTDGIVSAISGIEDDMRYYQISVPLQPGNSGGPLFNNQGDVIGITTARLNSQAIGADIENVNYAIKISYLLILYNMLPNAEKLSTSPTNTKKELQDQVKILKNYVCLIKVN